MHFRLVSYAGLGFLSFASALVARDSPEVNEKFGLYAYGDAVGGLSLFYAGGKAMIGDPSNSTSADAAPVAFTRASKSSSGSWIANPNVTTTNATYSWSDEMLYIPSSSASSKEMGFTSKKLSNETTTGFIFYGQWVMVENDSGDISSSFYIRSASEGEGVYSLLWDAANDDTAIPISLRSTKPSNA